MSPLEPQMVTIPAGIVTLGAPGCPNDFPLHRWRGPKQVEVKEYQIACHTVTRGDYERFVNDSDHPLPLDWNDRVLADSRLPVCGVSAEDADAYCAWLSDKTGRAYRLPHADEWEKAARGGLDSMCHLWGNDDPRGRCWWGQPDDGAPLPAGSFEPDGFGLYDMVGNIWQWLADLYIDVADDPPTNTPTGKPAQTNRVLVGGSFMTTEPSPFWVAHRHEDPSDLRHRCLGLRVALA